MVAVSEYVRSGDGNADAMVHAPLTKSMNSVVAMNQVGGLASDILLRSMALERPDKTIGVEASRLPNVFEEQFDSPAQLLVTRVRRCNI